MTPLKKGQKRFFSCTYIGWAICRTIKRTLKKERLTAARNPWWRYRQSAWSWQQAWQPLATTSSVQHCTVVPSRSAATYYINILLHVLAEAPSWFARRQQEMIPRFWLCGDLKKQKGKVFIYEFCNWKNGIVICLGPGFSVITERWWLL